MIPRSGMPHLSPAEGGAILSWWTELPAAGATGPAEEGPRGDAPSGAGPSPAAPATWALHAARWSPAAGLGEAREVIRGRDFFVNWADFPSVVEVAPEHWVAHWLQRNGEGTYAYGVRVAESRDAGATWSRPRRLHEDDSPTEHGFAAILPTPAGGDEAPGAWDAVWLDGRRYADGAHGPATDEMTVRTRHVAHGDPGPETLLDARACDCCQTDLAATARGIVAVYRDRSPDEIRDIALVRREDAGWTAPRIVHDDGWRIEGCPVNGPAVDADPGGGEVVVAWFTETAGTPRVRAAFSPDAGDRFLPPVEVDEGRPVGRVDIIRTGEGAAVVSWVEARGESGAAILARRVAADGRRGEVVRLAATEAARASGFPQLVPVRGGGPGAELEGGFLLAWTRPLEDGSSEVHYRAVASAEVPALNGERR